jgi:hypothetical protein
MIVDEVKAIQNRVVRYEIRQGIQWPLVLQWLEADGVTPQEDFTDYTWMSQLRDKAVSDGGEIEIEFETTPDADGNVLELDDAEAYTTFIFSEVTTAELIADHEYIFETKMINAAGKPVDGFQAIIIPRKTAVAAAGP